MRRRKLITHALLSGLLLGLSYPTIVGFWPVVFLALIPFFVCLFELSENSKDAFIAGFMSGIPYFAVVVSWYFAIYPLTWLGISSHVASIVLITVTFLLIIAVSSISFGLFALFIYKFSHKTALNILILPSAWVVFEYLRAWLFSLFWHGPGALIGPHWSFGDLGYSLHGATPLRMFASLGGIYFLSLLVVLVNTLIYKRWWAVLVGVMLIWFGVSTYLYSSAGHSSANKSINVVLVPTNFPRELSSNIRDLLQKPGIVLRKFAEARKLGPDIMVFPEGSELTSALGDYYGNLQNALFKLNSATSSRPIVLLDSVTAFSDSYEHPHARLVFFDTHRGEIGHYDKKMLFPGSEYIPDIMDIIIRIAGQGKLLDNVERLRVLDPGNETSVVIDTRYGKIGGLICGDILSPVFSRTLARKGAEIIMVSTSDAVYQGHTTLGRENQAMAQIRAVESGRTFIQATNYGESYAIDRRGRIIEKLAPTSSPKLLSLELSSDMTLYDKFGDWILILAGIILLINFVKFPPHRGI